MKKTLILLFTTLITATLLLSGCGNDKKNEDATKNSTTQVTETKDSAKKTETITLYYPDKDGEYLIPTEFNLPTDSKDKYLAVVEQIVTGPEKGQPGISVFPKGTKVLSVEVKDKTAYVNFNDTFVKHFPGGSTSELMIVGSLVDTLTGMDDIKQVKLLVEGKEIDTLSGHLDLSVPQTRMNDLIKK